MLGNFFWCFVNLHCRSFSRVYFPLRHTEWLEQCSYSSRSDLHSLLLCCLAVAPTSNHDYKMEKQKEEINKCGCLMEVVSPQRRVSAPCLPQGVFDQESLEVHASCKPCFSPSPASTLPGGEVSYRLPAAVNLTGQTNLQGSSVSNGLRSKVCLLGNSARPGDA